MKTYPRDHTWNILVDDSFTRCKHIIPGITLLDTMKYGGWTVSVSCLVEAACLICRGAVTAEAWWVLPTLIWSTFLWIGQGLNSRTSVHLSQPVHHSGNYSIVLFQHDQHWFSQLYLSTFWYKMINSHGVLCRCLGIKEIPINRSISTRQNPPDDFSLIGRKFMWVSNSDTSYADNNNIVGGCYESHSQIGNFTQIETYSNHVLFIINLFCN